MESPGEDAALPADELLEILDDLNDIIFRLDSKGNFTYVNKAGLRLTGYTREKACSLSLRDVISPELLERTLENFRRHMGGENPPPYETVLLDRSGGRHTLKVTAAPLYSGGELAGEIGVAHDITDRKRMEEEMRGSELQYRSTIDSMGDAIHVVDRNLIILLKNRTFDRWLGELGLGTDVVGKQVLDAFPFLRPGVRAEYDKVFKTGKTMVTTESHILGGRRILTETRKIPVFEDGAVVRIVTVVRDITRDKQIEEELRESEERYRRLVELSPDAIVVHIGGRIVYVNKAGLKLFKAPGLAYAVGKNILDFVHPDYHELVKSRAGKAYRGRTGGLVEEKMIRTDGEVIDTEVAVAPIVYGGKPAAQVVVRDVTSRRKVEQALRESEETLRLVFDRVFDAIIIADEDLRIVDVNQAACKMLGYAKKELLKLSIGDIHPKENLKRVKASIGRLLKKHVYYFGDITFINKNGELVLTEGGGGALKIAGKDYVLGSFRDITDRKRAEREILDVKGHLEAVLNGISESIVVIDCKYHIVSCNQAFQRWVGKPKKNLKGLKCYDVIHGFSGACRRCVVRDAFKTRKPSESVHYHLADGGKVYHETKAFPLLRDKGIERTIYVFRDVTDRERMKEQARQNYEQLVKANEELRKLDKMKTDFLSIASHELRTPLAIIKGYADILASESMGSLNPMQRDRLARIGKNAEHLNILVNNILDLTRIDAGELKLNKKRFSVGGLIGEVIEDMSHLAAEKGIKIKSRVEQDSPVFADRGRIKQVMVNLLDNALKFTPPGGRVDVSASGRDGSLLLKVSDNGIGIKKKYLQNVFKRFYQVDSSIQRKYKGAGLGLAICRRVVELHGGEIRINSRFGSGTAVSVKLPLNGA